MKAIIASIMAAMACALINPAWTGQDQEKKQEKVLEVGKGLNFDSELDTTDGAYGDDKKFHKVFAVRFAKGKTYQIDMTTSMFNPYLYLENVKQKVLAQDDDSGGGNNAQIIFTVPEDGVYRIITTSSEGAGRGEFNVRVKAVSDTPKVPATSHAVMIGKQAPNFQGDFAVNGKPLKLADLQGKVVLLAFWEVRSTAAIALLPLLAEWHKAHRADGLAMVSVTFYASDIAQKLGFDKETGKVTPIPEADHKSDQALLSDFARHHKIDHLLMALAKEEALNAFEAYGVNSLPQIVVIDRKGAVRLIHVGGAKNSADFEMELKKVLSEK